MKKLLVLFALAAALGLAFYHQAAARGPMGQGGGMMNNRGYPCQMMNDPKYQGFMEQTLDLRKELAAKRVEKRQLMMAPNPDPEKVAALTKEMVALRNQIGAKAKAAGITWWPGGGMCMAMNGGGGCGGCRCGCR